MTERIKRGETMAVQKTRTDRAGAPVSLAGLTLAAAVTSRDGTFYEAITVTVDNAAAGEFTLSAPPSATALWPVGLLRCDVRYSSGGTVAYSEDFAISVQDPVTVH